MDYTIDSIKYLLSQGEMTLKFTKIDGSERVIRGTTKSDNIPSDLQPKGTGYKTPDDIINIFDLDLEQWRSFRFENFKGLK